jgi:hypothetical protein
MLATSHKQHVITKLIAARNELEDAISASTQHNPDKFVGITLSLYSELTSTLRTLNVAIQELEESAEGQSPDMVS